MSALIEDIFDGEEFIEPEPKKESPKSDEKVAKKRVSWGDNTEHSPKKAAKIEGWFHFGFSLNHKVANRDLLKVIFLH